MTIVDRWRPETAAGGYTRDDEAVVFYTRINALMHPDAVVLDLGAGRGSRFDEGSAAFRKWFCNFQGRVRRVIGVEALLRWNSPDRGRVAPADFIPVAEESGLIVGIGEWVLRAACREAARWPELVVSVNVSPAQFRQRDLVGSVKEALAEARIDAEQLELEITEGVLIANTADALRTLRQLKDIGVRIAMDDFGTGYSSLSYLQKFPLDKIKIDQSFISGLCEDSSAIVRAIIDLGHSLGMQICAEGVETADQARLLRREGCKQAQGFLFGQAMEPALIDELLAGTGATRNRRLSMVG